MILGLNLTIGAVFLGGLFIVGYFTSKKKYKRALTASAIFGIILYVMNAATPSYAPKGTVKRLNNSEFVTQELDIQDRLKKPSLNEQERQERFDDKFNAVQESKKDNE